jgi:hypothetical protein
MKIYMVSINNVDNSRSFKCVYINALNRFAGMRITNHCYGKLGVDRARVSYDDWDPLPRQLREITVNNLLDLHTIANEYAQHLTDYFSEGTLTYTLEEVTGDLRHWFNTWGLPFTFRICSSISDSLDTMRKRNKLRVIVRDMEDRYNKLWGSRPNWRINYRDSTYHSEYGFKSDKVLCADMGRLIAESIRDGVDSFSQPFMEDYDTASNLHNRIAQAANDAFAGKVEFNLTKYYCDHWDFHNNGSEVRISRGRYRTYCDCCVQDNDVVVETYDTGILMEREAAYFCDNNDEWYEHEPEDQYDDDENDEDSESDASRLMSYSANVLDVLSKDESFVTSPFGEFHMGIELELVTNGFVSEAVDDLRSQLGEDYIICKSDGSLPSGGVEIVTSPRGLAEHIKRFSDWNIHSNYLAWNTGKCGMHIHLDSRAFTRLTLGKFIVFINDAKNAEFIRKIAGRHPHIDTQAQTYCAAEGQEVIENPAKALKGKSGNRYYMVNTTCLRRPEADRLGVRYVGERNFNTIELRVFRATLKQERLLAQIEFTHAVVMFCRVASMRDLNGVSFIKWLKTIDNRYPHLSDWYGIRRRAGAKNSAPAEIACADVTPAPVSA